MLVPRMFKNLWIVLLIAVVLLATVSCLPRPGGKETERVRIHIPVKHHTHIHTKTIIKKVAVPVPVPVKHHEPHVHEPYVHEEEGEEEGEEEEYESYVVPKKKKYHPYYKK